MHPYRYYGMYLIGYNGKEKKSPTLLGLLKFKPCEDELIPVIVGHSLELFNVNSLILRKGKERLEVKSWGNGDGISIYFDKNYGCFSFSAGLNRWASGFGGVLSPDSQCVFDFLRESGVLEIKES